MKNLYVFGNEYLEEDSLAREVSTHLHEVKVINCTSPEQLLDVEEKEIIILDVVKDIKETILITDVTKLKTRNIVSLHDFDLAFFLNLLKELDITKNIKIIGIPMHGDASKIAEGVRKWL